MLIARPDKHGRGWNVYKTFVYPFGHPLVGLEDILFLSNHASFRDAQKAYKVNVSRSAY